jgi:hypothetical protein
VVSRMGSVAGPGPTIPPQRGPIMRHIKSVLPFVLLASIFAFASRSSAQQNLAPSPAAQTVPIPTRIKQAIDEKNLVTLRGNVHPLARPEFDQGPVADSQPLKRMLLLLQHSPDQEAALQQLLEDQQNKSSANYHVWLTPEQFGKQFGPADADIQTVTQWLTSHGFTDIKVGSGRNVIEFSGNVGQVRNAFHTEIHRYTVEGRDYSANSADPQIPAALIPVVTGVVSFHNFPKISHTRFLGQFQHTLGKPGLQPLFTFPNPFNGRTFYGLGPGDFATIYNSKPLIAAGNDGTGQTIAIVGETNINVADVQSFRQMFGLPANFDSTNVILNGEDPGITSIGEEGEADLDVEWSGATAPGATVKFVVSASTPASAGIDLSALYIVEHNLAAVMSESYGQCEARLGTAGNAFYNSLWEQAAAQGLTVILSSGDGGSAGCDNFNTQQVATHGLAVSGLASTPFNVSLGGTDFDEVNRWSSFWSASNDPVTGTSALSYIPEIPWNENCAQISLTGCGASAPNGSLNIVAGSGGQSSIYTKPKWQMGVTGMPNDNHRDQPDVSLFASPGFDGTGYVYCQSDQTISGAQTCNLNTSTGILDFGVIGGTSASAPAFAGIMALVNQYQAAHSGSNRQGNANYVLYALAKKSGASCTSSTTEASTCIFNDVTKGNSFLPTGLPGVGTNSVPCQGGSPNCSVSVASSNGVLVDPSHTSTESWTATAGYDMTSGLGSVNVNNLATNWGTASTIGTTTTLTLSPTAGITHGTAENVTVGITVTANTGTGVPTGDVSLIATFSDGTTRGLDHFTLASGAVTSAKTQSLPGGTYTVSAHYAGDGTNAPSDSSAVQVSVGTESSQTFIVIPTFDSQGILLNGNATSVTYGSNYIIRVYVTDKNAVASTTGPPSPTCFQENDLTCPSGTVTLTDNSALLGTGGGGPGIYNLNNSGYTRDLSPALTGGTYSLVAKYSGDSSYQASTSATDTFTVTPAPGTQLQFTSSPTAIVGTPLTLNIFGIPNVASGATATGTVSILDGSTLVAGPVTVTCYYCTPGEPVDFTASAQVTFTTSGNHTLTANYSGDADYASASATLTVDALYPTTVTVTPSSSTINYGQSVTITATVVSSGKSPAMTGNFTFGGSYTQIPGPVTGTPGTDASGNQTLTATVTTTPQSGEYVQVNYAGDSNFESAFATSNFINVSIPDFTLGPASGISVVPTAGQAGSGQITITPSTQTPSTVNLSLQSSPTIPGYTLSLSPQQVSLNGSAATVTFSMTPTVGVPTSAVTSFGHSAGITIIRGGNWWSLSVVTGLAALFLLGLPGRRERHRPVLGLGLVCLFCLTLGCGGGSGGPGGGGGGPTQTSIVLATANAKVDQNSVVTITAQITAQHPLTGMVSVYDYNNQFIGTFGLNGNVATIGEPGSFFGIGVHQITAKYSGDTNNLPSTSNSLTQVITGTTSVSIQGNTGGDFHYLQVTIGLQ